jgi:hypothetical protein
MPLHSVRHTYSPIYTRISCHTYCISGGLQPWRMNQAVRWQKKGHSGNPVGEVRRGFQVGTALGKGGEAAARRC